MPLVEYACKCGERPVLLVSTADTDKEQVCGKCGQAMKRNFGTTFGAFFKGGGFHCTDYPKNEGVPD